MLADTVKQKKTIWRLRIWNWHQCKCLRFIAVCSPPKIIRKGNLPWINIDRLVQIRSNSSALAMELRLCCIHPSMYSTGIWKSNLTSTDENGVSPRCRHNVLITSHKTWCTWTVSQDHDDFIRWKKIPRYWPFVREIHRSPVKSPHKGRWHGALVFLSSAPEVTVE